MKNELLEILELENRIRTDDAYRKKCGIPEKCFLLGDGKVLCYKRADGDSRYPYSVDGLTLWAYSSGEMSLNESAFYTILPSDEGKEPYIAFFGGNKERDGSFTPISITGVARQAREPDIERFTYYTPQAAYYITKTPKIAYAVRAFVSESKQAVFSLCALNLTHKPVETYLSSFFNCLLMHQTGENVETKWFKKCATTDNGFIFESIENIDRTTRLKNYGVINRALDFEYDYAEHTTSRSDYAGGKTNSLSFAAPLFDGHFRDRKQVCKFGDTAAAGDIYAFTLAADGCAQMDYFAETHFNADAADKSVRRIGIEQADELMRAAVKKAEQTQKNGTPLEMRFDDFTDLGLNGGSFTEFIANVERQVEFAALAKNSGASLLGVRDVTQQLEAALMWNAPACRAKFIEMLGFIDPSGRAPRQYSIPAKGATPQTDTREFIDQGNWIISALHTYLAFTDDSSVLDEICGYYKITGANRVERTEERNTVGEHIARIADFLISNIDKTTGCLRALYGDWNDALDGLGVSADPEKEFGSGVSVMASLHLYKNLEEMLNIISKYGDRFGKRESYEHARARLESGLKKFAVVTENGKRKIIHGWGDDRKYLVGSFCDVDEQSRDGLTANAFWVISGAYLWDKTLKSDILASYDRLDSKYGLKTFEPHFEPHVSGVGRIVDLPKGTAENGATYVHATLFGIMSLFGMGEEKRAWAQLGKILPLTHERITTTPFIMSNSYAYNEELGLDGESMSDWFTGSANMLIKTLVRHAFGIRPDLDGVLISPPLYAPFKSARISLTVKGKRITLEYVDSADERRIKLNGKPVKTYIDEATGYPSLYLKTTELSADNLIEVIGR